MKKITKSHKAGLAPGSLIYVGDTTLNHIVEIEVIRYNSVNFNKVTLTDINQFENLYNTEENFWINITGVHNIKLIQEIGDKFKIHPLIVEDILNTTHRPKVEFSTDYIFATLNSLIHDSKHKQIIREHVSILLMNNVIITFQETPSNLFASIEKRMSENIGRIRKMKIDYILYAVFDSIIDGYFKIVESLDENLERVEDNIQTSKNIVADIHLLKKQLLYVRRSTAPLRDMISSLLRDESDILSYETRVFWKDAYDHCIQVYEAIELARDIVSGLLEMHLSFINTKMNEIMKYLTIFASIFIPLTFITGIYGMNFENMPELHWQYGYYMILLILFGVGFLLLYFFRKKKWI